MLPLTDSVICCEPLTPSAPLHPSPEEPPPAVQLLAPATLQLSVAVSPSYSEPDEDWNEMPAAAVLGTMRAPVLVGSSTDCSVAPPVVLVGSAVEFHTAESCVKSATPFAPLGAVSGTTGQAS